MNQTQTNRLRSAWRSLDKWREAELKHKKPRSQDANDDASDIGDAMNLIGDVVCRNT